MVDLPDEQSSPAQSVLMYCFPFHAFAQAQIAHTTKKAQQQLYRLL